MITITIKLRDGRQVCVVPTAVAAFEEVSGGLGSFPCIRLVDGTVYECEPIIGSGEAAGLSQAALLANAFSGALQQLGQRIERRQALMGGHGGVGHG